jgi:hypothetical protein
MRLTDCDFQYSNLPILANDAMSKSSSQRLQAEFRAFSFATPNTSRANLRPVSVVLGRLIHRIVLVQSTHLRPEMIHELVFACKPLSLDAVRTACEVAEVVGWALVNRGNMSSQITLAAVMLGAAGVGQARGGTLDNRSRVCLSSEG